MAAPQEEQQASMEDSGNFAAKQNFSFMLSTNV